MMIFYNPISDEAYHVFEKFVTDRIKTTNWYNCCCIPPFSDSTVLAYIMKTLNDRYNYGLNLILLSIDEGITGYRDDSLEVNKYFPQEWKFSYSN